MNLGALKTLVRDLNFECHGVPISVKRPLDEVPIVTRGIWVLPQTESLPGGTDFQRHEPVRVLAISRDAISSVPRGTVILAPERAGTLDRSWRVEGVDRMEADHVRVVLVPAFDLET